MADTSKSEARRERSGGGRSPNPAYELFVLGELMGGPKYGYKLQEILQRILGPFHRLSWGTLYPLFRRLEGQELITSVSERRQTEVLQEERGQRRKLYHLSDAGRARFFALMLEQGDFTADYPSLFAVKLSKFGYLTREQRVIVLGHYRSYIQVQRDHFASGQERVATNPRIGDHERPFILQLSDNRVSVLDAELAWLDKRIAQLNAE